MPRELDNADHQTVTRFLSEQAERGPEPEQSRARAAIQSGVFYRGDRLLFWPQAQPRMSYGAVVVNNPNPDLPVGAGGLNKARLEWNQATQQIHRDPRPGRTLAGEYLDSFEATGTLLDRRRSHFAASTIPLTFSKDQPRQPGVPQIFSAYEFARWVGWDLHQEFGKLMMANGTLNQMAFYAHLFDALGAEVNWVRQGRWSPDSDAELLFRRMYTAESRSCC